MIANAVRRVRGLSKALFSISSLTVPTIVGQAIAFVSLPLFTRWYSAHEFGYAATCLAIGTILGGIFTLRLEGQLFLSPDEEACAYRSCTIAWYATMMAVVLSIAVTVVFFLVLRNDLYGLLLLCIVSAWSIALTNIASAKYSYQKRYTLTGLLRLLQSLVTTALLTGGLFLHSSIRYYVAFSMIAGLVASALVLLIDIRKRLFVVQRGRAAEYLVQNRHYVLIALPQGLANSAGFFNLFLLIVGFFYGPYASGIVFLGYRIAGFPANLLSNALSNYVSSEFARQKSFHLFRIVAALASLSVAIYLPFALVVPIAALLVAKGAVASLSGTLYPILILCAAQIAIGPLLQTYLIRGGALNLLVWELTRILFSSSVTAISYYFKMSFVSATWMYATSQVVFYVVLAGMIIRMFSGTKLVSRQNL
jgi:O-antigen/teichoic acid export membrane protein